MIPDVEMLSFAYSYIIYMCVDPRGQVYWHQGEGAGQV